MRRREKESTKVEKGKVEWWLREGREGERGSRPFDFCGGAFRWKRTNNEIGETKKICWKISSNSAAQLTRKVSLGRLRRSF